MWMIKTWNHWGEQTHTAIFRWNCDHRSPKICTPEIFYSSLWLNKTEYTSLHKNLLFAHSSCATSLLLWTHITSLSICWYIAELLWSFPDKSRTDRSDCVCRVERSVKLRQNTAKWLVRSLKWKIFAHQSTISIRFATNLLTYMYGYSFRRCWQANISPVQFICQILLAFMT